MKLAFLAAFISGCLAGRSLGTYKWKYVSLTNMCKFDLGNLRVLLYGGECVNKLYVKACKLLFTCLVEVLRK